MNYIELINNFWQCNNERPIGSNATALYFYLLKVCNSLGWKYTFKHSDRYIAFQLGISVNTVRNSKNKLKQLGLIDFKAPEKASKGLDGATTYNLLTVSNFDTVADTVPDTVPNTVADTVPDTVPDTRTKLNKTKLNYSKYHSGESPVEEKKSLEFWKEFVEEFDKFYFEKLGSKYSYLKKDFANFKKIYVFLKKRIETKNKEFTKENLCQTFQWFLGKAWEKSEWLQQNFTVSNVLSQFNQIVNDSKIKNNGNSRNSKNGNGKLSGRATLGKSTNYSEFA